MITFQINYMILLISALFLSAALATTIYTKETINSSSALCLDGTPSVLYVSKGSPHHILLHFQSGGWCASSTLAATLQSCYNRSLTKLGSSKYSADTIYFNTGILSDSQPNYFTNWTKIFLSYCDGAGHQGYSKQAIKYKNSSLYFRGSNITLQRFEYLQTHYGLYSGAAEVVLSGASAGGLATYFWGNYLQTKLVKAKYWIFADSGIFLDSHNFITGKQDYKESLRQLLSLSNADADPPISQCVQKYPKNKEMCMLAQNIIEFLEVDSFSVQSLYDFLSHQDILGINCSTAGLSLESCNAAERQYIEQYHKNTTTVLQKIKNLKGNQGFWANACVYHGYSFFSAYNSVRFRIPSASIYSIDYTFALWKEKGGNLFLQDEQQWPANAACSNYAPKKVQYEPIQTRHIGKETR